MIGRADGNRNVDDRVADELPRPVVRDVAATLHRHEVGSHRCRLDEHVDREIGTRAVGEHVGVFEQQQVILGAVRRTWPLHRERLAVRNPAEPADPQRHVTTRPTSCAVSSVCLILTRKPAA